MGLDEGQGKGISPKSGRLPRQPGWVCIEDMQDCHWRLTRTSVEHYLTRGEGISVSCRLQAAGKPGSLFLFIFYVVEYSWQLVANAFSSLAAKGLGFRGKGLVMSYE